MKTLTKTKINNIIEGANFLGTGGGGTIADAEPLLKKIERVDLINFNELIETDLVCTVFGIGGKQTIDPVKAVRSALSVFMEINKRPITAIVPVELGAESIATALFAANTLGVPVLNSDLVGLRSAPEVYLELISLINVSRTPCVIADDKNNTAVLWNTASIQHLELLLRSFAVAAGGDAYIAGYPMQIKQIRNATPQNSLILAEQAGEFLREIRSKKKTVEELCTMLDLIYYDTGIITSNSTTQTKGFESGEYTIKSKSCIWKVVYKNENIILLKNDKVVVTAPDSILLMDTDRIQGINNFNKNSNKKVMIFAKKAVPIWRTRKGRKLFSPQQLGLQYEQVLL